MILPAAYPFSLNLSKMSCIETTRPSHTKMGFPFAFVPATHWRFERSRSARSVLPIVSIRDSRVVGKVSKCLPRTSARRSRTGLLATSRFCRQSRIRTGVNNIPRAFIRSEQCIVNKSKRVEMCSGGWGEGVER